LAGIIALNVPFLGALRKWAWWGTLALALAQVALGAIRPAGLCNRSSLLETFFAFGFTADNLSLVLLLSIGIVMSAVLLVGRCTIRDERRQFQFLSVLLVALIGMNGTVLLTDLFSLYVFIEITSVASLVLIAMNRDKGALEGAFNYIILSAVATVLMLTSVALVVLMVGDTAFGAVRGALKSSAGTPFTRVAMGTFVCGLFIKGGVVPFHGWVPDVYSAAPAPVSVLLAGIATKVSGIYALIRVTIHVFASDPALNEVLLCAGLLSILVGAFAALGQADMKRMLAYSSVSQVGYIVLALGCGTPLGVVGAVFHLFNHAVFKSLLFVNSAAVEERVGTTGMTRLGGLANCMPLTGATCAVAALSTAGVPPLAGFWSKLVVVVALWQAQHQAYALAAGLLSVLTLGYLLVMQRAVFFGKTPENLAQVKEASPGLLIASVVLGAVTLAGGLLLPWMVRLFPAPAGGSF
jgi:multicomponent Na+:H+ antiporter subunit D